MKLSGSFWESGTRAAALVLESLDVLAIVAGFHTVSRTSATFDVEDDASSVVVWACGGHYGCNLKAEEDALAGGERSSGSRVANFSDHNLKIFFAIFCI